MSERRRRKQPHQPLSQQDDENQSFPAGAIVADLSKQIPINTYGPPVLYYLDKPFTCIDCGKNEIWTARQQQWYFEEAGGSLHARAIRCHSCRMLRIQTYSKGDPNPIKHLGTLFKYVQAAIDPALTEAGFRFVSKTRPKLNGTVSLDYSRHDLTLSCRLDRHNGALVAETMNGSADCNEIARVPLNMPRSTAALIDRISAFSSQLSQNLSTLLPAEPEQ